MGTLKQYGQTQVANEITVMETLRNSPNIIHLIDSIAITETKICLLMDLCQTDLQKIRAHFQKQVIPQEYIIIILRQIANGINSMIKKKIFYRDLKLENVLVRISQKNLNLLLDGDFTQFKNLELLLCDFGHSKKITNLNQKFKTSVGTYGTMAPEVYDGKYYDMRALMFSMGILIIELITGLDFYDLQYNKNDSKPSRIQNHIDISKLQLSDHWKVALKQMVKENPDQRLKWDDLVQLVFSNGDDIKVQLFGSDELGSDLFDIDLNNDFEVKPAKGKKGSAIRLNHSDNSSEEDKKKQKNNKKKDSYKNKKIEKGEAKKHFTDDKLKEKEIMQKIAEITKMIQMSYKDLNQDQIFNRCMKHDEYEVERQKQKKQKISFHQNQNYDAYLSFFREHYASMRKQYAHLEAYEINKVIGRMWQEEKNKTQMPMSKKAKKKLRNSQQLL